MTATAAENTRALCYQSIGFIATIPTNISHFFFVTKSVEYFLLLRLLLYCWTKALITLENKVRKVAEQDR